MQFKLTIFFFAEPVEPTSGANLLDWRARRFANRPIGDSNLQLSACRPTDNPVSSARS